MTFDNVKTIRYMGAKSRLLDFIVPNILEMTNDNDTVVDIMAGSYAISYALKKYRRVVSNDIQQYSAIIGEALMLNQDTTISSDTALDELASNYQFNLEFQKFNLFYTCYADTYFSKSQCLDIDSIRYAISCIDNKFKSALYMCALMNAMCLVQSTPGHFAQYMPNTNLRIQKLQQMSMFDEFLRSCNLYSDIVFSKFDNRVMCDDFHNILNFELLGRPALIYLDSPYTQEQYSRFYHVLETVTRYDWPEVKFKAKYRCDRFMSRFCYKSSVEGEFKSIFECCKDNNVKLLVSYSNKGVISVDNLINVASHFFGDVEIIQHEYFHSTQGKGSKSVNEILLKCY